MNAEKVTGEREGGGEKWVSARTRNHFCFGGEDIDGWRDSG